MNQKSSSTTSSSPIRDDQEVVRPTAASLINDKHQRRASDPLRGDREIDARIMESVFRREIEWWRGEPSYLGEEDGGWKTKSTVPRFSTNLFDAMKVLDAWKGGWRSTRYADERNFTVTLYANQRDSQGVSAQAETFMLAVCLAALKAVEL